MSTELFGYGYNYELYVLMKLCIDKPATEEEKYNMSNVMPLINSCSFHACLHRSGWEKLELKLYRRVHKRDTRDLFLVYHNKWN